MMFHKDILLLEANEETKLLEAEEADPGTKVSFARDRRLSTFALTTSGVVLLLLLCVVYHNAAKGKNWADDQSDTFVYSAAKGNNWADSISSSKEKNTIVNDRSGTFVYAMTYGPGLCYKKTESEWPGCVNSNEEWTEKLTIHGLWPEYEDGTWPATCSNEELDTTVIEKLSDQLQSIWPDFRNDPSNPFENTYLYEHEWTKHGTCSGMTQETYFTTALSLYVVPTPPTFIKDNYGSKVPAKDLIKAFGGEGIAFPQCKGSYLKEVRFCVQPRTGNTSPVFCPEGIKREMEREECKGVVTIDRFMK